MLTRYLCVTVALLGLVSQSAAAQATSAANLRSEVDSLHTSMVSAFKQDPASVARFYAADARIIGMGSKSTGRSEVDRYWGQISGATDWTLEIIDVGGTRNEPWVLGRSTLVAGGRGMVTDYLAILARGSDGRLRYRIDLYTQGAGMPRP